MCYLLFFFFFNDTATTEIYTLSLHDALPISHPARLLPPYRSLGCRAGARARSGDLRAEPPERVDRSRVPAVPRPATCLAARKGPVVPDAGDRILLSRVRGDPGSPASGRGLRPCTEPRDVRHGARGARPRRRDCHLPRKAIALRSQPPARASDRSPHRIRGRGRARGRVADPDRAGGPLLQGEADGSGRRAPVLPGTVRGGTGRPRAGRRATCGACTRADGPDRA